jgi:hypothetical protein
MNFPQKLFSHISFLVALNTAEITVQAGEISGLSPTSVIAGNWEELTITGSGFGSTPGEVWWTHGDSNRGTRQVFHSGWTDYLQEWSDGRIRIIVPSNVGTGFIQVKTSTGEKIESHTELDVKFNLSTVDQFYERPSTPTLIDNNGLGGYTFYFDSSVPESAKESFRQALHKWVGGTGVNWAVNDSSGDALITFELLEGNKKGTAQTTTSIYSASPRQSKVTQLSIQFDNMTNWYYGEDENAIEGNQVDFESVALHELGHCLQLDHVVDQTDVMHSIVEKGETKRDITSSALAAALYVRENSPTTELWGSPPMSWISNRMPIFNEGSSISLNSPENQANVTTVTASDADGDPLTFSINGTDSALFNINAETGRLDFQSNPDFERPNDIGKDNTYEIVVTASDGKLWQNQKIRITVTDLTENRAPSITSPSEGESASLSISENSTSLVTIGATDADGDSLTYSITGGVDQSHFLLDATSGVLTFRESPDFEKPMDQDSKNDYEIQLLVSDGIESDSLLFTIRILDLEEQVDATSWSLAEEHEADWKSLEWFGYYYQHANGWIYHAGLGWLYRSSLGTDSIWLWQAKLGWMWTSKNAFPYFYEYSSSEWTYYDKDSSTLRFYNYGTESWFDLESETPK